MNPTALLSYLSFHKPHDAVEAQHLQQMVVFIENTPEPFSRSTAQGHVTGSAMLMTAQHDKVLLIWHEKLGRWLQPGGHCEPDADVNVQAAALRELIEETGLPDHALKLVQEHPFDVDVHVIPTRGDEPEHLHYDVRYLFQLIGEPADTATMRWISVDEVTQMGEQSLARMGNKLRS